MISHRKLLFTFAITSFINSCCPLILQSAVQVSKYSDAIYSKNEWKHLSSFKRCVVRMFFDAESIANKKRALFHENAILYSNTITGACGSSSLRFRKRCGRAVLTECNGKSDDTSSGEGLDESFARDAAWEASLQDDALDEKILESMKSERKKASKRTTVTISLWDKYGLDMNQV